MARRRRTKTKTKTQDPEPGSANGTPGKRRTGKPKRVTPSRRKSSSKSSTRSKRQTKPKPRSKPRTASRGTEPGPDEYLDPLWTEAKPTVNGLDTILASREAAKRAYFRIVRLEDHETRDGEVQEAGEVGQILSSTAQPEIEIRRRWGGGKYQIEGRDGKGIARKVVITVRTDATLRL